MKFIIIAELLLIFLSNGIRFYATKKYIDFFVSKENCKWKYTWILYILACIGTYAVSVIFNTPSLNLITNILAIFLLTLPCQVKLSKKLFITFVIYSVSLLTEVLIVQFLTNYVEGKRIGPIYELIVSLVILISATFLKNPQSEEKDTTLPRIKVFILGLIPLISIVCIHSIAVLTNYSKPVFLTSAFCLILINAFLFYLYHTLTKFYAAQMNEKKLEQIAAVYAHQLDVMQESQEQMKKLQHDMKHHMIELSAMAQQNENKDMVQYLEQMTKFMLNPAEKVSTGNQEIDGILNYSLRRADELLHTVNTDIQIPRQLYKNNFNICVILGNLLENALREAVKSEDKFLSVSIRMKKDILLILIENSYTGTIVKEADKFKTSQKNKSVHGIGLESVKQVVTSCGGDLKIEYTENRFLVQVLLYLSNIN